MTNRNYRVQPARTAPLSPCPTLPPPPPPPADGLPAVLRSPSGALLRHQLLKKRMRKIRRKEKKMINRRVKKGLFHLSIVIVDFPHVFPRIFLCFFCPQGSESGRRLGVEVFL